MSEQLKSNPLDQHMRQNANAAFDPVPAKWTLRDLYADPDYAHESALRDIRTEELQKQAEARIFGAAALMGAGFRAEHVSGAIEADRLKEQI